MKNISHETEQSVIGAILVGGLEAIKKISHVNLSGADFYDESLGRVFDTAVEMSKENSTIDLITVKDKLNDDKQNFNYLATLAEGSYSLGNLDVYSARVKELSTERSKRSINYNNYKEITAEIDKLENSLNDDEDSIENIIGKTVDYLQDISVNGCGLSSGFKSLDSITCGLRANQLIIIAGRPSMGKSTLALNIAANVSVTRKVLFFSLEMSQVQLMMKLVAADTEISLNKIDRNKLDERDSDRFYTSLARTNEKNLILVDKGGLSVRDVISKAKQVSASKGLDLIVIDYLQILKYDKGREVSELGTITRELKGLSKELNIPVILLSQLSRGVEQRDNKRPFMSDLRSSGEIEQDADVIMFVYRDEYYYPDESPDKGLAELIIAKNRMGQVGYVKVGFRGEHSKFFDV